MSSKYEHIRQLYLEKISGIISASDEALLMQMLMDDPECHEIWSALIREDKSIRASEILNRIDIDAQLESVKKETVTIKKRRIGVRWVAAAAVLVLLFSVTFILLKKQSNQDKRAAMTIKKGKEKVRLLLGNGKSVELDSAGVVSVGEIKLKASSNTLESIEGGNANSLNTLFVPTQENYNLTLSDGTRVRLNSESRLRFPSGFAGQTREVYLEGEAYFEVTKDEKHPFIVHTDLTSTKVLGTSFNLNTYGNGVVRTSLVSGAVQVTSSRGDEIELKPGFEAAFSSESGFVRRSFDKDEVLSWMSGVYYFHNITLSELSPVIKRWFGADIIFENEGLPEKRISGLIEKNHLDEFLKDLQTSTQLRFTLEGNKLRLAE